jgi:hypothetical protein
MAYVLGMNCKAYYHATPATALSGMTELTNVKDVSCDFSTGEADITIRGNNGWRATAATLKECTVTFKMQWDPEDAGFTAIQAAWLAASGIELAFLTGAKDASGAQGPKATFTITNFSRDESLEEAVMTDVTAKVSVWDEWVNVGAAS